MNDCYETITVLQDEEKEYCLKECFDNKFIKLEFNRIARIVEFATFLAEED